MLAATAGNRIAVKRSFARLSIASYLVSHTAALSKGWYRPIHARTNAVEINPVCDAGSNTKATEAGQDVAIANDLLGLTYTGCSSVSRAYCS